MSIKQLLRTTTLIVVYEDGSYLERIQADRYRLMYHEGGDNYRVGEVIPAKNANEAISKARALRAGLVMNCL